MKLASISDHFDLPTNRLYAARDRIVRSGRKITDFISANPGLHGIEFPPGVLQAALRKAAQRARVYRPDPLGQLVARTAVERFYAAEGLQIPTRQIVITPGTSISYWYAFKLLADAGDEILCPSPGYPLFETIAELCSVKLVHYRIRESARWEIDFDHLESLITPRTKALILISPHNPTGSVASEDEVRRLGAIAAHKGLAIISDEVFSPFVFQPGPYARPAADQTPLVLTLNGLSKMLALPGMKIGWMGVTGEAKTVERALKTLEMISDTFLPVNEIAQFALPDLLRSGRAFLKSYRSTVKTLAHQAVDQLTGTAGLEFIAPEGGFYLTLRLNDGIDEETAALQLLERHGILVHPGYFYDLEGSHWVLSYLARPATLNKGLAAVKAFSMGYRL